MTLDGLNTEQRAAAEAVGGRVCILAGAGTGKTTTVTHRIAQQVATGAFAAAEILAVTFTEKAAGELKARLAGLGVAGVRASTFHSAALAQLRHFQPGDGPADPAREGTAAPPDRQPRFPGPTASGRPAISRRRSNGPRTGASRPSATGPRSVTGRRRYPPI